MKVIAATLAALTLASVAAAATPPRTTAMLFHPSRADLAHIAALIQTAARKVHVAGKTTLDVSAACKTMSPAINATGLGYRHVLCTLAAPGSLHVHGSVLFSIRAGAAVYAGQLCALGLCQPMRGKV